MNLTDLSPYKDYAKLAGIAALLLFLWWEYLHIKHEGLVEGRQEIQVKFDAYKLQIDRLTAQRETENAQKLSKAIANNQVKLNDYQAQLAAISADNHSLSKRLRDGQTCRASVPKTNNQSTAIDSGKESSSQTEIDAALDQYDRTCQADAAQLNALIGEISPQL